jgi:antitoxin VapB
MHTRQAEAERKIQRLARAAADARRGGVLLLTHWNFAWLTAGASNRIDISREAGAGALLVGADGRRFAIANSIEMPRLQAEALTDLDFQAIEIPWTDERADPSVVRRRAAHIVGGALAADVPGEDVLPFEPHLSRLRARLEPEEVARFRRLGADAGRAAGEALRTLRPGITEIDAAREVAVALLRAGMRPLVLLAAADDRLLRYRHPIPTTRVWRDRLMVAAGAERDGLSVSLSRLLSARAPDPEILVRLGAARQVFAALLDASTPGASAARLFHVAAEAYAAAGFPGEESRHHQGGACGYRSREWIAHPHSPEAVLTPAALAWNPTVTGTKVEDTCLVLDDGLEIITSSPDWPSTAIEAQGQTLRVADHLVLDAG